MGKVTLKGHIIFADGELEAVTSLLPDHIALTRAETGCLTFDVTRDEANPNRFNVYEEFRDRAAFEAHQARVQSSDWGAATVNVERHYEVTES